MREKVIEVTAPAPIFFPPIIATLVAHLNSDWCQAILRAVPDTLGHTPVDCVVESEVPNPRPPRLVTLFTVPNAGAQSPVLSTRRIVSQIYEGSEWVTGSLAEKVRGLIVDSKYRELGIKHVKVIGEPAKFPTPGEPWRWQFTADVTIRALAGPWS
jgi:hypothetical protein